MNKIAKIKLMNQMSKMNESTEQCVQLLQHIEKHLETELPEEVKQQYAQVIQHNKNVSKFFGIMQQQLQAAK
ncbi:hypothetical protein [Brevibacillus reuszeri]|uniref:hypothetical protein n=1 Tax=Brevibacillus reuszeri TaxID=54915 RepID=UPI000CCC4EF8|nr:hypothetical protein [Brevibacillus reuszeri]